jgi:hypothetical protein
MNKKNDISPYTEWVKSRLDEMEAVLKVVENTVEGVAADTRKNADQTVKDMKKHRDAFKAKLKDEYKDDAKAWSETSEKLEKEWDAFEDDVEAYWKSVGEKSDAVEDAFKAQAEAQQKAWNDTAERIRKAAAEFKADRDAEVDAAVAKADLMAQNAGAKLGHMGDAGKASWAALRSALTESRSAFDAANTKAQAAFKDAMKKNQKT